MRRASLLTAGLIVLGTVLFVPSVSAIQLPNCTGPIGAVTIDGNVFAGPNCELNGTHVTGNVRVASYGNLTAADAEIDGNLQIDHTAGENTVCDTSIGRDVQVNRNTGSTTIGGGQCSGNDIGRDLRVYNNTGEIQIEGSFVGRNVVLAKNSTPPNPITILDTSIGRDLDCRDNVPAAVAAGSTTVDGTSKGGQCVTSETTQCPAGGCEQEGENGDTSYEVDVPPGGKGGKLEVILSAPPEDDGCMTGGGRGERDYSGTPVGSIVTVKPPPGYTGENPIIVHISWPEPVTSVCKSPEGKPPYTELPECYYEDEGPPPVPCWVSTEDGVDVYMTSKDPAFSGH